MTGKKVREYLRCHILGLVAIFIALTGTAIAGQSSAGDDAPKASARVVTDKKFKKLKRKVGALEGRLAALEAKPDQVGEVPASLPPSGPASGALTGTYPGPELAANAVTGEKLAANAVTGEKLADTAVTGQKIAFGTITANKFHVGRSMQLLNFPSIPAGNCSALTVFEGVGISRFTDHILATPPGFWTDTFTLTARADGDNDAVRLVACNVFGGGGAADPDGTNGGFYHYVVIRQQ